MGGRRRTWSLSTTDTVVMDSGTATGALCPRWLGSKSSSPPFNREGLWYRRRASGVSFLASAAGADELRRVGESLLAAGEAHAAEREGNKDRTTAVCSMSTTGAGNRNGQIFGVTELPHPVPPPRFRGAACLLFRELRSTFPHSLFFLSPSPSKMTMSVELTPAHGLPLAVAICSVFVTTWAGFGVGTVRKKLVKLRGGFPADVLLTFYSPLIVRSLDEPAPCTPLPPLLAGGLYEAMVPLIV